MQGGGGGGGGGGVHTNTLYTLLVTVTRPVHTLSNTLYDYSLNGETETSMQVYLTKPKGLGYTWMGASKLSLSKWPSHLLKGCVYMYMYIYLL